MNDYSMPRPKVFVAIAFIASLLFVLVNSVLDDRGQVLGRDFVNIWHTSSLLRSGDYHTVYNIDDYNSSLQDTFGENMALHAFLYPPTAFWLSYFFSFLSYLPALILWSMTGLLLYAFAVYELTSSRAQAGALLLAPAVLLNIDYGQNGLLTAALLCGAVAILRRLPVLAGFLFGLLVFKPTLGLLVPVLLVLGRHWAALISATVTTLCIVVWSALISGLDTWSTYIHDIIPFSRLIVEAGTGALVNMMPTPVMMSRQLGMSIEAGYLLQLAYSIYALIGLIALMLAKAGDRYIVPVFFVATIMVSPYVHNYDMCIFTVAIAMYFKLSCEVGFFKGEKLFLGLGWVLPVLMLSVPIAPVVIIVIYTFMLLKYIKSRIGSVKVLRRLHEV